MTKSSPQPTRRARRGRLAILVALVLLSCPLSSAVAEERLEAGRFLVAGRQLRDPNFRETVVLLVEYDRRQGALGLIVNRPSRVTLGELLPDLESENGDESIFRGGPVDPMQVTLLVRSAKPEADEAQPGQHVFEDVYFSSSKGLLEWLATAPDSEGSFRAFAGYAGWSPGQLEVEIEVGGWHVMKAEAGAIFEEPSEKLWPRLILEGTAEWAGLGSGERNRQHGFASP